MSTPFSSKNSPDTGHAEPPRAPVILVAIMVIFAVLIGLWKIYPYMPFAPVHLTVRSDPPGAMVFLDERYLGPTPLENVVISRQVHMLRVQKSGYRPRLIRLTPKGGKIEKAIQLQRLAAGKVRIVTVPAGARVFIDGKFVGRSPLELSDLRPGPHRVRASRENYDDWEKDIQLKAGKPLAIQCTLRSRAEELYLGRIQENPRILANYIELAHHYILRHQFRRAAAAFKAGVVLAASGPQDRDQISRLYQEIDKAYTGQFDYGGQDAMEACRSAIDDITMELIQSNSPGAPTLRQHMQKLYSQTGRERATLRMYEALVEARPSDTSARAELAMMYVRKEMFDKAMKHAEIVKEKSPKNWQAWYVLGLGYRAKGDKQKARAYLKIARLYCPDDSTRQMIDKLIQELE